MVKRILAVDDEPSILTLLSFNLERAGFQVLQSANGREALDIARTEALDLVILDVMLPEMDGLEVCRELRQEKSTLPVMMLTAKDDEFDKVLGLELGADDYMTKPFSPRELVARVKALLRRSQLSEPAAEVAASPVQQLTVGDLVIDPSNYEATFKGELMTLTPKEFELLYYLVKNSNKVLTRDQLLSSVWQYDFAGDTRIVDVHVSHLREKIEDDTRHPKYIITVRGLGYKFEGGRA
ncbi:response regulator transcription factor [Pullulanibacillus sp. KACC 23026]|uniref:response regulator transcription factor n=1 Tax=Pullulanibacillus sp. KACC 23026 TaxID=3028315 RepID=UPI0023B1F4C8|nr:response regulator transcription factor [Pullulanibacillus sp. KACC 23026]WEG13908.1 response regulator transcription factor [Pullulanibacillus sp. KACC 23026]